MASTPDLLGVSALAAQEMLRSVGLTYREIGTKASDSIGAGAILSQDPPAGEKVPRDTVVKVVLSEGASSVVVPNVTKMSLAQAEKNLIALGLQTGEVQEEYHEHIPKGYVATTLPEAGARVVPDTAVDLIVSLGKEPPDGAGTGPGTESTPNGNEQTLNFVVPSDLGTIKEAHVSVTLVDDNGARTIYEGNHKAGERIPAQTFTVTAPVTARIIVDGKLRAERQYTP
jgi:beta-lactam-binding protein with PASTA domain